MNVANLTIGFIPKFIKIWAATFGTTTTWADQIPTHIEESITSGQATKFQCFATACTKLLRKSIRPHSTYKRIGGSKHKFSKRIRHYSIFNKIAPALC